MLSLLPGHALPADCCSSLHLPSAAGLDHRRLSNWRRRVVSADCERERGIADSYFYILSFIILSLSLSLSSDDFLLYVRQTTFWQLYKNLFKSSSHIPYPNKVTSVLVIAFIAEFKLNNKPLSSVSGFRPPPKAALFGSIWAPRSRYDCWVPLGDPSPTTSPPKAPTKALRQSSVVSRQSTV